MVHNSVRRKLLASTIIAGALIASVPAFAQGAAAPAADTAADSGDTIIVTGSRIARPQVEASVPVAVVSATSIQDAGQTNLLDALRDLPIAGQSADRSASNFLNSGNGQATVNLRNLGPARTLVLINSRRSIGVPGSSAVDLNNIPVDLIDHVEVVTGGASAIYGSDAVAGVVNILLKNNFTGLSIHGEQRITDRGDGATRLISVLAGKDFADGAGHITAIATYTKDDAVASSSRGYSAEDSPSRSSYTPQGVFDTAGGSFTFDSNNNVIPYDGSKAQRFNRASLRLLATPVERYSAGLLAHYDFSPAAQLYGEFLYNRTIASGRIEPLAVDDGPNQGQSVTTFDGRYPTDLDPTATAISTNNPYVPAAIAAAAGGPNNFIDFRKRSTGIFDRSPIDHRDYYRGVIGLKGEVGSNWHYDLSYEHSYVRDDTSNEAILLNNYGAALQAVSLNGQIVCADPVARAAGCVPVNPFGTQPYTAAQLKFLSTYTGQGVTIPGATAGQHVYADFLQKNSQDVASASLTGSLFQLPDGPLGVAVGAEYRHEKVSEVYDPFTRSGASSQQLNGNEFGSFNVKEGFVELNAPLFGHHPWIYALTLEGAARYSDYSTIGGVWTFKYGGTFAPTPDIRFRAIFARAVRAPNLNELYSSLANTAQQVTDPCDQDIGLGSDTAGLVTPQRPLAAGCTAIPAIATYLQTHQNFAYTLAQVQTIFGFAGGNPNLGAEATNTFTAGTTFTPRFLRNFVLTADYYTVKVKNAIATVDPQTSVDQCFKSGGAGFCSAVFRDANGFITRVDQATLNAASYLVAGIDVQALYTIRPHLFNPDERIDLDFFYNHKLKQQQTPFVGGPVSNELGTADTYASQQLGTGFKDQFTFNLNYKVGPTTLHYRLKYLGPVIASGQYSIPAYTYHDVQLKFEVAKRFEFYAGVNNLLDKDPPFIAGGNSQWPGTNTVADTYDLLGRTLYAGATVKF